MNKKASHSLSISFLLGLAVLTTLAPFATDMYLPAFPAVQEELHTASALVQLTLTAFMVGMGFGQLIMGPWSDSIGRKKLLITATSISLIASLICAIAPNIWVLLIARVLVGFGSGGSAVIARSIVADLTRGREAAAAYSLLAMIMGVAPVIAPLLGGIVDPYIGWRGVFIILSAIACAQLVISFCIKESRSEENRTSAGVGEKIKVFRSLLKDPCFRGYAFAYGFGFACLFAYISASPYILQNQLGLSTFQYSLVFAFNSFGLMLGAMFNRRLLKNYEPGAILIKAIKVLFIAGVLISLIALFFLSVWAIAPVLFMLVMSMGFIFGNATALGQEAAGIHSGSAAALMGFLQAIFGGFMSPLVSIGSSPALAAGICIVICATIAIVSIRSAKKHGPTTAEQK